MVANNSYFLLKIYIFCLKFLKKAVILINACFVGFWLGILKREKLHFIDKFYYDNEKMYQKEEYNLGGFWDWEKDVLNIYFKNCKSLLLIGAGGGRELLALSKLKYIVDAYECHPELVEFGNKLVQKEGFASNIQLLNRDDCPETSKVYDGIIIGWGAYMLIQGKKQRINFLKKLHSQMKENAPVLLSFFCYSGASQYFKIVYKIGNLIRWVMRRELLDLGDNLEPEYVHYFTQQEIATELKESGFELAMYSTKEYGHAVGICR